MAEPDLRIDTDKPSRLKLSEQIDVLTMSPAQSRKLLKKIGTGVRKDIRENVKAQRMVTVYLSGLETPMSAVYCPCPRKPIWITTLADLIPY